MIQINLLPWREQARQQKRKEFGYTVGAFVALTIIAIIFTHIHYAGKIKTEIKRNAFLRTEVGTENQALLSLNDQLKEGETVDAELHFLMSLREKSYQAVSLLDELARVMPEAVTLTQVTREGSTITIFGKALSDYQITLLMKSMSKSHVFNQPELNQIDAKDDDKNSGTFFQLKVTQKENTNP